MTLVVIFADTGRGYCEVSNKRSGTRAGSIRILLMAPIELYTKIPLKGPPERLLVRNRVPHNTFVFHDFDTNESLIYYQIKYHPPITNVLRWWCNILY